MTKNLVLQDRLREASLVIFNAGSGKYQFSINRTTATITEGTKVYTAMLVSVVYTNLLVATVHAFFMLYIVDKSLSELWSRAPSYINYLKYEIDAQYNEALSRELDNSYAAGVHVLPITTTSGNMKRRALSSRVKQAQLTGIRLPRKFDGIWDEIAKFDFGGRGVT